MKRLYTVTYFKPIKTPEGEVIGMQTHNRACDTIAEARAFEAGLKAAGLHTNILTPEAPAISEREAGFHLDLARSHAQTKWDEPAPVEPKSIKNDKDGLRELGYLDAEGLPTSKSYETVQPGLNCNPRRRGADNGPRKRRKLAAK